MGRGRQLRRLALCGAVVTLGAVSAVPAAADSEPTTSTSAPTTSTTVPANEPNTTTAPPTTTTSLDPTTTTTVPTPTTTTTAPPAPADAPDDDAPEATPAASAITVTPSTGLGYRQDVTVTGTGFSPNVQVGFTQCEAGTSGAEGCNISGVRFATTDANGAFSGTITVRRFLHNQVSGEVDCASAPATCHIGAGRTDSTEGTNAPLTFDPNAPIPPPPTLTLDTPPPFGGINVPIGVQGSGYDPNTPVQIVQCKRGSSNPDDCQPGNGFAFADANGAINAGAMVFRAINTGNELLFDCTDAPGCDLVAFAQTEPERRGVAQLEFDPSIPLPPGLELTVAPDTDLADQQIVTVTVTGMHPGEPAVVAECPAGEGINDECRQLHFLFGDGNGVGTATMRLPRTIGLESSPLDCAGPGACDLVVRSVGDHYHVAAAPLDFDPNAAPLGPTIAVLPGTDLVHRQVVDVTGSGFIPGAFVSLTECRADGECGFPGTSSSFALADPNGNIHSTFAVARGIRMQDGSVLDCVDPPGCDLIAQELPDFGPGTNAKAPLHFDPSVALPPPPPIAVSPAGPYADREIVTVTGEGFPPNSPAFILQCVGAGFHPGGCISNQFVPVDANGAVHGGIRVRRFLTTFSDLESSGDNDVSAAATADCAVDECSIVVMSFQDPFAVASTPLVIDPNAPRPPPPTVVVEPDADLADGQVVSVRGSGFTPGTQVALIECRGGATDPSGRHCDLSRTLRYVSADGKGDVDTTYAVRRTLTTNLYGTVDCATALEGCFLGFGGTADLEFERGNVPLHFASDFLVADPDTGLPRTGGDSTRLAVWGALALVSGVLLRVATRRRRRARDPISEAFS